MRERVREGEKRGRDRDKERERGCLLYYDVITSLRFKAYKINIAMFLMFSEV